MVHDYIFRVYFPVQIRNDTGCCHRCTMEAQVDQSNRDADENAIPLSRKAIPPEHDPCQQPEH